MSLRASLRNERRKRDYRDPFRVNEDSVSVPAPQLLPIDKAKVPTSCAAYTFSSPLKVFAHGL